MTILSTLGIDWKLLLAQLVNFAILLVLLQKFLYKPLLGVLDARSKTIEKSLEDAKKIEEQLKVTQIEQKNILEKAKKDASALIEQAGIIVEQKRQVSVEKTKEEVTGIIQDAREKIEYEKQQMLQTAKEELGDLVIAAAKAVLVEGLDSKLSDAVVKKVVKKTKE